MLRFSRLDMSFVGRKGDQILCNNALNEQSVLGRSLSRIVEGEVSDPFKCRRLIAEDRGPIQTRLISAENGRNSRKEGRIDLPRIPEEDSDVRSYKRRERSFGPFRVALVA